MVRVCLFSPGCVLHPQIADTSRSSEICSSIWLQKPRGRQCWLLLLLFFLFLGGGSGGAGLGELFFISGVPRALVVPRCRWDIYGFVSGRGGQAELTGAGEQGTGGACAEPRFLTDRLTNER